MHCYYTSCLIVVLSRCQFINSQGGPGHNIPAELHMDHLNRLLKGTVSHLGANKTPQAIVRAGKPLEFQGISLRSLTKLQLDRLQVSIPQGERLKI